MYGDTIAAGGVAIVFLLLLYIFKNILVDLIWALSLILGLT